MKIGNGSRHLICETVIGSCQLNIIQERITKLEPLNKNVALPPVFLIAPDIEITTASIVGPPHFSRQFLSGAHVELLLHA